MKKLTIFLLTITLISCSVFKKSTKEKTKEEAKTETEVKVDSIAEVKAEKETKNDIDTKTEIEHQSDSVFENTKTTTEVQKFDSLGRLVEKSITTTENNKGSLKSNKKGKKETKEKSTEKSKESSKVDLLKSDKSKSDKSKTDLKKDGEVKKTSLPKPLLITIGITFFLFIIIAVWKIKKKYFPL